MAAFAGALHCGVSGGVSLAVGPMGRQAEVIMQVRDIDGFVSFVAQYVCYGFGRASFP